MRFRHKDCNPTETGSSAEVLAIKTLLQDLPASGLQRPILLGDRMKSLHLDPDGFARLEPIVFQELSVRCRACDSTARCASDLARNSSDEMNEEWRDYCPNAPTLNMLDILQDCSSALTNRGNAR
jgi:hypothetical protein